eukprot:g6275.t1
MGESSGGPHHHAKIFGWVGNVMARKRNRSSSSSSSSSAKSASKRKRVGQEGDGNDDEFNDLVIVPPTEEELLVQEEKAREERKARRAAILARHKKQKRPKKTSKRSPPPPSKKARIDNNQSSPKVVADKKKLSVDMFDMFSADATVTKVNCETNETSNNDKISMGKTRNHDAEDAAGLHDNWDDAEGYYSYQAGDILDSRYLVLGGGEAGKGVFSNVVFCSDQSQNNRKVAIKILRANQTMRRAGQKELLISKQIASHDHPGREFSVRLLDTFDHRNHLCLVFEALAMNVRDVLKKLGKNTGMSLEAVRLFARQIFLSLRQMDLLDIVHADLKPDNMLISANNSEVKVCDFGSAFFRSDPDNDPTPYLVSRFYRAPEIILGLKYDSPIDIWAAGCCLYEMFTGRVLFPGKTNNEMLRMFMAFKGPFTHKILRRHFNQYKMMMLDTQFCQETYRFKEQTEDPVSKQTVTRLVTITHAKPRDIIRSLQASMGPNCDRKLCKQLLDLLQKCLALDPEKRITAKEALLHPFCAN